MYVRHRFKSKELGWALLNEIKTQTILLLPFPRRFLRFYGSINQLGSCRARSIYLTTLFLDRLIPLSGKSVFVHILPPETDICLLRRYNSCSSAPCWSFCLRQERIQNPLWLKLLFSFDILDTPDTFRIPYLPEIFTLLVLYSKPLFNKSTLLPVNMCKIVGWVANSVEPDQTPHSASSDLGLLCLLRPVTD